MERVLQLIDRAAGKWLDWRLDNHIHSDDELAGMGFTKAELDDEQVLFKKAEVTEDGFQATYIAPSVAFLAHEAALMLDKSNARNYVQFDMMPRLDRGLRPIRVTVAWAHGVSPALRAAKMEMALRNAVGMVEAFKNNPTHEWNSADEEELQELSFALAWYGGSLKEAQAEKGEA